MEYSKNHDYTLLRAQGAQPDGDCSMLGLRIGRGCLAGLATGGFVRPSSTQGREGVARAGSVADAREQRAHRCEGHHIRRWPGEIWLTRQVGNNCTHGFNVL